MLSPGQDHESRYMRPLLERACLPRVGPGPRRCRPDALVGDKGYSAPHLRRYLRQRGIRGVIPRRRDEHPERYHFDRATYRRRNIVERCIGWLKECRRIGTRFDKLAGSYLGMVVLAFIRRCARLLHLSDTA